MPARNYFLSAVILFLTLFVMAPWTCIGGMDSEGICRPKLIPLAKIPLGSSGVFSWHCQGGGTAGSGYYIVFIRPSGTYVLLRVPENKTSFEFTPDTEGTWRWIVINTHPDRTKPDIESEPAYFEVAKDVPDKN